MQYFEIEDVRDGLLKPILNQSDIDEATDYIEDLALKYGVDPKSIPSDVPFTIKKIAMYYALATCAQNTSQYNDEGDEVGPDAYEMKRRIYQKRLSELEATLSVETFTGGAAAINRFPTRIPFGRC